MSKNKKVGRPKLSKQKARKMIFPLRMSPPEHAILTKAAAESGKTFSKWARNILLDKAAKALKKAA